MRYVGSYAGSFDIRLEGEEFINLTDESKLAPVLKRLFEMLDKKEREEIIWFIKNGQFCRLKKICLATPTTCRSSPAGDQTCAIAATRPRPLQ